MTMRRLAAILTVLSLFAGPALAQTQPIRRYLNPASGPGFPTCDANTDGVEVIAVDPVDDTDCATGSGTASPHPCVCDGGATTWTAVSGGVSDHGALTGLADDDHTQYALLAGRSGETVFNDAGANVDFRVEGDTNANLLFVDAGTDRVGVATGSPSQALTVSGTASTKVLIEDTVDDANDKVGFVLRSPAAASTGDWTVETDNAGNLQIDFGPSSGAELLLTDSTSTNSTVQVLGSMSVAGTVSAGDGQGILGLRNATTRPSTAPTDGVILSSEDAAAGAANLFAYNEGGQRVRLTGVDARVPSGTAISASTTLVNVSGLSVRLEAGKTYSFIARLMYYADASGGIMYKVSGTATATSYAANARIFQDGAGVDSVSITMASLFGAVGSTAGYVEVSGAITVNAAGTLVIQEAQQVATGVSGTKQGSTLHIREIS